MMYEMVIFDLGGVVVDVNSDGLIHQLAQQAGRTFEEVHGVVYHEDLLLPFELGRISPRTYYEGVKAQLNLTWTYEQFVKFWNNLFTENADVTQIMRRLRNRYRLTALSNTNELHINHLKATVPSLELFHDWVISSDVGMRKPEPGIYQVALQRARVQPHAAVYIDDRPELVEAGRRVGLTGIRFENSRQLEEELRVLGVNV